jgi:chemotaxis protein methyltransferase CheR
MPQCKRRVRVPANVLPDLLWLPLRELIVERMGLHFSGERKADLYRGLEAAAREFNMGTAEECAEWLLSGRLSQSQVEAMAAHLTVGETYFFRERKTFEALRNRVLPDLISARRNGERRLRAWSAGCCTGEEPYSLAILLHEIVPDLADWQVTILATDINPRSLRVAINGTYGEWSFRDSSTDFKNRYFERTESGRYSILPAIKNLVSFQHLNLAEDRYPSIVTNTNSMDLIFCRNVLMYFAENQIRRVVEKLGHSLTPDGWLAVSPSEVSQELFQGFATVNFPGATLYRKSLRTASESVRPSGARLAFEKASAAEEPHCPPPAKPVQTAKKRTGISQTEAAPKRSEAYASALRLYEEGLYREAAEMLINDATVLEAPQFSLLARSFANQGELQTALSWCDRWIAVDKVDGLGHYFRGIILLEQGADEEARRSLLRSLFLKADFVLAHFALANLERSAGRSDEANKHYKNALRLLALSRPNDLLPEAEGLTSGRLTETITSLMTSGGRA